MTLHTKLFLAAALALAIGATVTVPLIAIIALLVAMILFIAALVAFEERESPAAKLTAVERQAAYRRLPWVDETISYLARASGARPLRPARFCGLGAGYRPFLHRIDVSRALCARLGDEELRLILAALVARSLRRFQHYTEGFTRQARVRAAFLADVDALRMTGASASDLQRAIQATFDAERVDLRDRTSRVQT